MEKRIKVELAIIGGGPGGYVAALRAAQMQRQVVLVEEDRVGGTCTNYGCIPTKFLLNETQVFNEARKNGRITGNSGLVLDWAAVQKTRQAIIDRLVRGIEFLLARNRVQLIKGRARLIDPRLLVVETEEGEVSVEPERLILATGSRAANLPGLEADGQKVVTSREALEIASPPRRLIIIGAGAIGLEIGSIFSRIGTKVTILEILSRPLPGADRQLTERLGRILKRQGLEIKTEMRVEKAAISASGVRLSGTCLRTGEAFSLEADLVLLAAGRRANSELVARLEPNLCDRAGFVRVNEFLETAWPGVYAVGDLIGGRLLAHKAMHEGIMAAENAFGAANIIDQSSIPMAVFTDPELASVGLCEEEAQERGIKFKVGLFPLQASGRAVAMEKPEGLVKIIADEEDRVIGAHLLSPAASEMIGEMTLAVRLRLKLEDLARTVHVHPTLAESIAEASLKALGRPLHSLLE
ncbi:MAG: dihydrolipoyl dehydrogenase [Candidatus Aminicenantales bacterium]